MSLTCDIKDMVWDELLRTVVENGQVLDGAGHPENGNSRLT
jgi:hypothetical protein